MQARILVFMVFIGVVVACGGGAPSGDDDDDAAPDADAPTECGPPVTPPTVLATNVGDSFVLGPDGLYFSDDGTTLWRVPIDGGSPSMVASDLPATGDPEAADATAVYWLGYENGLGEPATLVKVPLDGSPETLVSMALTSTDTGVFAEGGRAYWADGNDILSIGSDESTPAVLATAATSVRRVTADQNREHLYFADAMSIYRLPLAGGGIMEIVGDARDSEGGAQSIVATADRVYWTGQYSLNTCAFGCAEREVIDETTASPWYEFDAPRLGPNGLYYVLDGASFTDNLMFIDGPDGLPTSVFAETSQVFSFEVDECRLYWLHSDSGELKTMSVPE